MYDIGLASGKCTLYTVYSMNCLRMCKACTILGWSVRSLHFSMNSVRMCRACTDIEKVH